MICIGCLRNLKWANFPTTGTSFDRSQCFRCHAAKQAPRSNVRAPTENIAPAIFHVIRQMEERARG